MRSPRFILALLGLVFALNACGKSGPDMPPASEFPKAGEPARLVMKEPGTSPTVLRFAPTAGDKDTVKLDMDIDMDISAAGQTMDMQLGVVADMVNVIDAIKDDKSFVEKTTMENAKVTVGGQLASQLGGNTDAMRDMMNGQVTVLTMDAQGRIASLETPDNPIMNNMGGGMDNALKGNAVVFPDEAVGVGAVWQSLSHIDMMGLKLRFVSQLELLELDGRKGKVKIAMRGGLGDGEGGTIEAMGNAEVKSMTLEGGGTVAFDLDRPTASTVDLELKMASDLKVMGENGSFEVKMKLKASK